MKKRLESLRHLASKDVVLTPKRSDGLFAEITNSVSDRSSDSGGVAKPSPSKTHVKLHVSKKQRINEPPVGSLTSLLNRSYRRDDKQRLRSQAGGGMTPTEMPVFWFLRNKRMFVPKSIRNAFTPDGHHALNYTHTCMNGGGTHGFPVINVSDDEIGFHNACVETLALGERLFWSSVATNVFRPFVDVDMPHDMYATYLCKAKPEEAPEFISHAQLVELSRLCQEVMLAFYKEEDTLEPSYGGMIPGGLRNVHGPLDPAPGEPMLNPDVDLIPSHFDVAVDIKRVSRGKTGIHIIFPNLRVDAHRYCAYLGELRAACFQKYGTAEIVDAQVVDGLITLRMPRSDKPGRPCPEVGCALSRGKVKDPSTADILPGMRDDPSNSSNSLLKRRTRSACGKPNCSGGWLMADRLYETVLYLNGSDFSSNPERVKELTHSMAEHIATCDIRTPGAVPTLGFASFPRARAPLQPGMAKRASDMSCVHPAAQKDLKRSMRATKNEQVINLLGGSDVAVLALSLIQSNSRWAYGVDVRCIKRDTKADIIRVFVSGENSKVCQNKDGPHTSEARIWFEFTRFGWRQRCKSDWAPGPGHERRTGTSCKEWRQSFWQYPKPKHGGRTCLEIFFPSLTIKHKLPTNYSTAIVDEEEDGPDDISVEEYNALFKSSAAVRKPKSLVRAHTNELRPPSKTTIKPNTFSFTNRLK